MNIKSRTINTKQLWLLPQKMTPLTVIIYDKIHLCLQKTTF